MAKLNIYVYQQNGKTVSKFGKVKDNEKIVFHNKDTSATLEVRIASQPGSQPALCLNDKTTPAPDPITVSVTEQSKSFAVCKDFQGETFKYTATLGSAAPEDPIIIIERWSLANVNVPLVAAVGIAAVTLVLGAYLGAMWARRRSAAPR